MEPGNPGSKKQRALCLRAPYRRCPGNSMSRCLKRMLKLGNHLEWTGRRNQDFTYLINQPR